MRFDRFGLAVVMVLLAAAPSLARDDTNTPKARLATIAAAQQAAFDRYAAAIQKVEPTEKAQQAVVDRFYAELQENVEAAFELAPLSPHGSRGVRGAQVCDSKESGRSGRRDGEGVADDSRTRRLSETEHQGKYLAHVAVPLFQYPDAEKVLSRVIDENPSRADRGQACYWLAQHLRQQAKMVRRLRAKPGDMKDYEKYKAAQPIAQVVP